MVQSVLSGRGTPYVSCFLSDILGKKVYDKEGGYLGAVADLIATTGDRYPEIEGFTLARKGSKNHFAAHPRELLTLAASSRLELRDDPPPLTPKGRHFFVRETLYDKQIVDINGAKVERVNDVRLLLAGERPYLIHVDVGFTGLARRMGFEGGVRRVARLFGREIKDELIGWRFVQPLSEESTGPIHLALRHDEIKRLHAGELADIFEELDRDERLALVRTIGAEDAAEALEETDLEVQTAILRDLDTDLAADILEEMEPAAAADLIDKLPTDTQASIMEAMEDEERAQIERLSLARDNTAEAVMTVDFISCHESTTVGGALDLIREKADDIESITYVYCLDSLSRLVGVVSLRDLLLARADARLSWIMNRRLASLNPFDDLETVAYIFMKFRFKALPVVDAEGQLQGLVTFQHSFEELLPFYYKMAS